MIRTRRRSVRRARTAVVLGLAAAAVLTGCTNSDDQAEDPTLSGSTAVSGDPLEDDPAVQLVRRFELLYADSYNAHDFTGPGMSEVADVSWREVMATVMVETLEADGPLSPAIGPRALIPIGVDDGRDSVTVAMCGMAVFPTVDDGEPRLSGRRYTLDKAEDGTLTVRSEGPIDIVAEGVPGDSCEAATTLADLPRALFDPAPAADALEGLTPEDVIAPAD